MPKITREEIQELLENELPWGIEMGFEIDRLGVGEATVRLPYRPLFVRPGGTVAGPLLMGLADFAIYVAVMSMVGRVDMAVTTNLNCNFLRRPKPEAVIGEARVLKLGKRLAYGEVSLFTAGEEAEGPVAHVTATYSLPPAR